MREDNIEAHTEHLFTFFKVQGWVTNIKVILSTRWRVELITQHARSGAIFSGKLSVIIAVFLTLLDRNSYREFLRTFKVGDGGGGGGGCYRSLSVIFWNCLSPGRLLNVIVAMSFSSFFCWLPVLSKRTVQASFLGLVACRFYPVGRPHYCFSPLRLGKYHHQ